MEPKLYKEPDAHIVPVDLTDADYGKAIQALIVVCVDIAFYNPASQSFFLAKRKAKPLPEWWFIGGRVKPGEEVRAAAIRKCKMETGLVLSPDRLSFLVMNRYMFKERAQEPQTAGADSLAYLFTAAASEEEMKQAALHLDPKEYEQSLGFRKFSRKDLESEHVHQAALDAWDALFRTN